MKDTLIVYIGIAVLIVIPFLYLGFKTLRKYRVVEKKRLALTLGGLLIAVLMLLFSWFTLYRLTLEYQAPLVAERYLLGEGYTTLEAFGFDRSPIILLSETIYEHDDGTVGLYAYHEKGGQGLYSLLTLEASGYRWQIKEQTVLSNPEDHPELQKRFYVIQGNP